MQVQILRPFRKDNIYFRTIVEREKIIICTVTRHCLGNDATEKCTNINQNLLILF